MESRGIRDQIVVATKVHYDFRHFHYHLFELSSILLHGSAVIPPSSKRLSMLATQTNP
jgi:aryl-alcohol dehydrogenase-like predicted oxidoreductase